MTLLELKSVFTTNTEFCLVSGNNELWITNILWSWTALSSMQVNWKSVTTERNKVFVQTDMPDEVFQAWKDYTLKTKKITKA